MEREREGQSLSEEEDVKGLTWVKPGGRNDSSSPKWPSKWDSNSFGVFLALRKR